MILMSEKSLICIYTNKEKNEFAIGLKEDDNFRAMTKADEFYTRFVDVFDQLIDKNRIDWEQELKNWIAAARKMKLYLLKWTLIVTMKYQIENYLNSKRSEMGYKSSKMFPFYN